MNTLKRRRILEPRSSVQAILALALIGCSSSPGDLFASTGHAGSGAGSGTTSASTPGSGGAFNAGGMGSTATSSGTSNTGSNPDAGGSTGGQRDMGAAAAGGQSGAGGQRSRGGQPATSSVGSGGTGSGGTGSGGTGSGGAGSGGAGSGGAGPSAAGDGPSAAVQILSIDFVGGTTKMLPAELAGVKAAAHWNGAAGPSGSLPGLMLADGSASPAAVAWDSSDIFSVGYVDAPGDTRMMNGYLDPRSVDSPAKVTVTALPTQITSPGYDVYVYAYGDIVESGWMRTFAYAIAGESIAFSETGTSEGAFSGYLAAPAGGAGNYVVFRNLSGSSFTLLATPGIVSNGLGQRAPVNGIQIVSPSGS